jgi:hypothetical protein
MLDIVQQAIQDYIGKPYHSITNTDLSLLVEDIALTPKAPLYIDGRAQ